MKTIETTINLYLDGRLSPAQQEDMKKALAADPDAQVLFEQLCRTDALIKSAGSAFGDDRGASFESIYTQAKDSAASINADIRRSSFLRFVSGVAAGLLIAVGLFVGYKTVSFEKNPKPAVIATGDSPDNVAPGQIRPAISRSGDQKPYVHDVDLYYYKDEQGNEWLVEGVRHEVVKQASASSI